MTRDLYRAAHKAIRHDLFETSARIATTDFADAGAVAALVARFDGLAASLRHHGEIEDRDIHPLAESLGVGALDAVEAEHATVDAELEALVGVLADLAASPGPQRWAEAHAFYLRFNRYVAAYLLHADREEREVMPALAAAADPATLVRVARADLAGPIDAVEGALRAMLPLFNVEDRRVILADVRAGLSDEDDARITRAAQDVLEPAEWAKLAR